MRTVVPPPPIFKTTIIQMKGNGSNTSNDNDSNILTTFAKSDVMNSNNNNNKNNNNNNESNNGLSSMPMVTPGDSSSYSKTNNTNNTKRNSCSSAASSLGGSTSTGRKRRRSSQIINADEMARKRKELKTAHSIIEKKRRIKMNREFEALKYMIPACRSSVLQSLRSPADMGASSTTQRNNNGQSDDNGNNMHKLTILQSTVEYIAYLHHVIKIAKNQIASSDPNWLKENDLKFIEFELDLGMYRNIDTEFDFNALFKELVANGGEPVKFFGKNNRNEDGKLSDGYAQHHHQHQKQQDNNTFEDSGNIDDELKFLSQAVRKGSNNLGNMNMNMNNSVNSHSNLNSNLNANPERAPSSSSSSSNSSYLSTNTQLPSPLVTPRIDAAYSTAAPKENDINGNSSSLSTPAMVSLMKYRLSSGSPPLAPNHNHNHNHQTPKIAPGQVSRSANLTHDLQAPRAPQDAQTFQLPLPMISSSLLTSRKNSRRDSLSSSSTLSLSQQQQQQQHQQQHAAALAAYKMSPNNSAFINSSAVPKSSVPVTESAGSGGIGGLNSINAMHVEIGEKDEENDSERNSENDSERYSERDTEHDTEEVSKVLMSIRDKNKRGSISSLLN
ncbi:hypothetical protein PACTADRAFT_81226 [Pachysolen tannophilus NRRL Y-2460]|uniref:BHLH domain-containing protein n=1 Tax=Pachysolen tannophilus NRRL Y-2460 TaxID=669874 RepID=A0A1E4TSD5_PACTA|nr:hypothetical protein PACTADRAFT_81226 [Pachysolen tannophilus NRRL Y-2460]